MDVVKKNLYCIFLISIFYNIINLISSFYIMHILDRIIPYSAKTTMIFLLLFFIFIHIMKNMLSEYRIYILQKLFSFLAYENLDKIVTIYSRVYCVNKSSYNKIHASVTKITELFKDSFFIHFFDLTLSLFFIITFFFLNFGGFILLIIAIFLRIILHIILTNNSKKNNKLKNIHNKIVGNLNELNNNIPIVASNGLNNIFSNKSKSMIIDNLSSGEKIFNISFFIKLIRPVFAILIVSLAAYDVINNKLTTGVVIASSIIFNYAFSPFENIQVIINGLKNIRDNYCNIFLKIIDSDLDEKLFIADSCDVEFESVSFEYTKEKNLLNNVNFTVPSGNMVYVSSANGCGKSTLLKLIAKILIPTNGMIKIGGNNVNTLYEKFSYNNILYVNTKYQVINEDETILENIKGQSEDVKDEEVVNLINQFNLSELIFSLKNKINTKINEINDILTDSQRHRLLAIKILLSNVKIIIIDDIDIKFDPIMINLFYNLLHEKIKNKKIIAFYTSRNTSVIGKSDLLISIHNGAVVLKKIEKIQKDETRDNDKRQ